MKRFVYLLILGIVVSHQTYSQRLYDNGPLTGDGYYVLPGAKWNKTNLTYYIYNTSSHLTSSQRGTAIQQAFNVWANNSILTFTQVSTPSLADLKIKWASGDHGDGYPFDGGSGVLAHAFYPPPSGGSYAGELHFDDNENWTLDGSGIDLITVAIHEIGHLLGIAHSNNSSAIMYPYYFGLNRNLHTDDILAVIELYGSFFTITGPSTACYSGSTFTLVNAPQSATVQWNITGPFVKSNATNTSVTITKTGIGNGSGTLTASINGTVVASKTITPCITEITGQSLVCSNGGTFTINNLPSGATVSWNCSSNLEQVSGSGNTRIFRSVGDGSAWVGATVNGIQLTRFNTNAGVSNISVTWGQYMNGTYRATISVPSWVNVWEYSWSAGGWTVSQFPGNDGGYAPRKAVILTPPSLPATLPHSVTASVLSSCGLSYCTFTITANTAYAASTFPNPVSNVLNIELSAVNAEMVQFVENELETPEIIQSDQSAVPLKTRVLQTETSATKAEILQKREAKLYNQSGSQVRSMTFTGDKTQLNVSDLPAGIYYLHIYDGVNDKPEIRQIIVQH
jgi:hypothetical protein